MPRLRRQTARRLGTLTILASLLAVCASAAADEICRIESDSRVETSTCDGELHGGVCTGGWYLDVRFDPPFAAPPHVLVTPRRVSSQGGCVMQETDMLYCFPNAITAEGFRLYCYGGVNGANCGSVGGHYTKAEAQWIALEQRDGCLFRSAHSVRTTGCDQPFSEGSCKENWYAHAAVPGLRSREVKVLTAPERLGDRGVCAAAGIDALYCVPTGVKDEQFRVYCSGSPLSSQCVTGEDAMLVPGTAGWLALENHPACAVEVVHGLIADDCVGEVRGDLCLGELVSDITFVKPFEAPPTVLLTPEHAAAGPLCTGGAFDGMYCYASSVTSTGFRAHCGASPLRGICRATPGIGSVKLRFGYLAVQTGCGPAPASASTTDRSNND